MNKNIINNSYYNRKIEKDLSKTKRTKIYVEFYKTDFKNIFEFADKNK